MSSQSNVEDISNIAQPFASRPVSPKLPNNSRYSFTPVTKNSKNFGNKFHFKKASIMSRRRDIGGGEPNNKARLFSARPWTSTRGHTSFLGDLRPEKELAEAIYPVKNAYTSNSIGEVKEEYPMEDSRNHFSKHKNVSIRSSSSSFNSKILEYSDTSDIEFEELPTTSATKIIFAKPLNLHDKNHAIKQKKISPIRLKRFPSRNFRGNTKKFEKKGELELGIEDKVDPPVGRSFSPALDVDLNPELDQNLKKDGIHNEELTPPNKLLAKVDYLQVPSNSQTNVPQEPEIVVNEEELPEVTLSPRRIEESVHVNGSLNNHLQTVSSEPVPPAPVYRLRKFFLRFCKSRRIADISSVEQQPPDGVGNGTITNAPSKIIEDGEYCTNFNFICLLKNNIVFDSSENYFYYWIALVSTAYIFNLLVVIARSVFIDMATGKLWILWLFLDILTDSIYLGDMIFRSKTGFLEQGLLIRDTKKIRKLYFKSYQFRLDLLSLLPLDHLLHLISGKSFVYLRFNRLFRKERVQKFLEQTETRSAFPNAFRVGVVVWYIAVIIHWNACLYFFISETIGLGTDAWVYGQKNTQSLPVGIKDTLTRRYIYSFYWSTLILTTIGEVPGPQMNVEFAFVTIDLMCGVLIFATIVGNVGSMISNMSAARTDFQNRIDSIKQYMEFRRVGKQLEIRVIKWFDYLWVNKQNLTDQQVLKVLPEKLQAEIAMNVHFETLRKVRIFQDCEAGLLAELVLKLQLQVFSPMDYVCRKGDIGRDMYIVKRGMIQIVGDDENKVFATLTEGAVFGELSILNIAGSKNGNRRTANVRSVGYTDLFVLNKNDLWIALREYPDARKILIQKGRDLLRKDNLLDENAPEENKTVEEMSDELQSAVRILQTRIARLTAEHTNTEYKLQERIHYLESRLKKYGVVFDNLNKDQEDKDQEDWHQKLALEGPLILVVAEDEPPNGTHQKSE